MYLKPLLLDIPETVLFGSISIQLDFLLLIINLLFLIINVILTQRIKKGISQSKSFDIAISLRRKHRITRRFLLISYSIYNVVVIIIVALFIWRIDRAHIYALYIYIMYGAYANIWSKISILTIDDIKDERFSLYLRGFSTDSYRNPIKESFIRSVLSEIMSVIIPFFPSFLMKEGGLFYLIRYRSSSVFSMMDEEEEYAYIKDEWGMPHFVNKPFNELRFSKAFKKHTHEPIYAVGMTKELTSPMGTKRIYLDDNKWQDNVSSLIEKSDYIFVLVNPSDSCIWEIIQCKENYLNKTYFFIHDDEDLKKLHKKMGDDLPTCLKNCIEEGKADRHIVVFGQNTVIKYKNTRKGFDILFKELFDYK